MGFELMYEDSIIHFHICSRFFTIHIALSILQHLIPCDFLLFCVTDILPLVIMLILVLFYCRWCPLFIANRGDVLVCMTCFCWSTLSDLKCVVKLSSMNIALFISLC